MINLGSKSEIQVKAGDVFRLETPGGGGYGQQVRDQDEPPNTTVTFKLQTGSLHTHSQIQNSAWLIY